MTASERGEQRGFTLVELLAGMAISGMLLGVLVSAIFQITRVTSLNVTSVTAAVQVENVARWLAKDAQAAQTTALVDGAPAVVSATFSWTDYTDWGGNFANPGDFITHNVTYSLSGTDLRRNLDGDIRTVAGDITAVLFSRSGQVITMDITSAPEGAAFSSHQLTYKATMRSLAPVDNGAGPLHFYP